MESREDCLREAAECVARNTFLPFGCPLRALAPLERSHGQQSANSLGVREIDKPIVGTGSDTSELASESSKPDQARAVGRRREARCRVTAMTFPKAASPS